MQTAKSSLTTCRSLPGLVTLAWALAAAGCTSEGSGTDASSGSTTASTGSDTGTATVEPTGTPTDTGVASTGTESTGSTDATESTGSTGEVSVTGTSTETTETTDTTESTGSTGSTGSSDTTDGTASTGDTDAPETFIKVQIVALNDLHGNIAPPTGSSGKIKLPDDSQVDAGGVAFLASHVGALRADNPNTVLVSAGDLIGASPLASALFHDEPTIEVMNEIGLAYNAVGNHEFDHGAAELLRMQDGGCHPLDGCIDGTPFPGASFQFLAANVLVAEDPIETLFEGYAVHDVGGVKIAFIGMTLAATPTIVTPTGNEGLIFVDEVARANALVPELTAQGVEAIVVLIHEGGFQAGHYDECDGISGPIVDIVEGLDDAVDVVISGHTHQAYNCVIADKLVTSAASFGRMLTDIDLEISSLTGDVTAATAKNVVVTRDAADPEIESFVDAYVELAAPLANTPIGTITATLDRFPPNNTPGLSTMGAVLADAHLAATAAQMLGGAQIAFMNPGGVRADILFPKTGGEPVDGVVSYGEAFAVQPFGNSLVVMTLTGAQIDTLLEQQFSPGLDNILQVSKGFTYAYSKAAPIGAKVDPSSIKLDGVVIDPQATVRVTVISYLAAGGDSFSVLVDGTDRLGGVTDMEALVDYFKDLSPVSPPALDRIIALP